MKQALTLLPPTLDATYERMLIGIEEMYREEALRLLRWLAFQQRPLTLGEMAEAGMIDPSGDGSVWHLHQDITASSSMAGSSEMPRVNNSYVT